MSSRQDRDGFSRRWLYFTVSALVCLSDCGSAVAKKWQHLIDTSYSHDVGVIFPPTAIILPLLAKANAAASTPPDTWRYAYLLSVLGSGTSMTDFSPG